MVVAVRAVLVALVKRRHVAPERLAALFAQERHLGRPCERVVRLFGVALGALCISRHRQL